MATLDRGLAYARDALVGLAWGVAAFLVINRYRGNEEWILSHFFLVKELISAIALTPVNRRPLHRGYTPYRGLANGEVLRNGSNIVSFYMIELMVLSYRPLYNFLESGFLKIGPLNVTTFLHTFIVLGTAPMINEIYVRLFGNVGPIGASSSRLAPSHPLSPIYGYERAIVERFIALDTGEPQAHRKGYDDISTPLVLFNFLISHVMLKNYLSLSLWNAIMIISVSKFITGFLRLFVKDCLNF